MFSIVSMSSIHYLEDAVLQDQHRQQQSRAISVREIAEVMGVSLPKAYIIARSQGFPAIISGKRLVIPRGAFERWFESGGGKVPVEAQKP